VPAALGKKSRSTAGIADYFGRDTHWRSEGAMWREGDLIIDVI